MIKELLLEQKYDPNLEYDVIVVGTGPGGGTVAREMALKGRKVLMLERGAEQHWIQQNTLGWALMMNNLGMNFSKEMTAVAIPNVYGGASNLTCGVAGPPPVKLFAEVGITFNGEIEEAKKDIWADELPDVLVGKDNLRMLEAAQECGFNWTKLPKMIDAGKCSPGCSDCMLGCARRAKWTSRVFCDEALRNNADIMLYTKVTDIIVENGKAVGVRGTRLGKEIKAYAKVVVLSTGVSNVGILRNAGIQEAGRQFAIDALVFVGGVAPGTSSIRSNPMAVGTLEDYDNGFIMTETGPNWASFALELAMDKPRNWWHFKDNMKMSWIMIKIQDEMGGEIYPEKRFFGFSKPISKRDRQRLDMGTEKAKKILRRMGANESSIYVCPPIGAHPCGTCPVGTVLDSNLETRIKNLYCCDASVVHRSMGLPVVWTAVTLGKRLSKHLNATTFKGVK